MFCRVGFIVHSWWSCWWSRYLCLCWDRLLSLDYDYNDHQTQRMDIGVIIYHFSSSFISFFPVFDASVSSSWRCLPRCPFMLLFIHVHVANVFPETKKRLLSISCTLCSCLLLYSILSTAFVIYIQIYEKKNNIMNSVHYSCFLTTEGQQEFVILVFGLWPHTEKREQKVWAKMRALFKKFFTTGSVCWFIKNLQLSQAKDEVENEKLIQLPGILGVVNFFYKENCRIFHLKRNEKVMLTKGHFNGLLSPTNRVPDLKRSLSRTLAVQETWTDFWQLHSLSNELNRVVCFWFLLWGIVCHLLFVWLEKGVEMQTTAWRTRRDPWKEIDSISESLKSDQKKCKCLSFSSGMQAWLTHLMMVLFLRLFSSFRVCLHSITWFIRFIVLFNWQA